MMRIVVVRVNNMVVNGLSSTTVILTQPKSTVELIQRTKR